MLIAYVYIILINILTFLFMYIDKKKAIKGKWRIPEKRLFFLAVIGGAVGINIGYEKPSICT